MKLIAWLISMILIFLMAFLFSFRSWYELTEKQTTKIEEVRALEGYIENRRNIEADGLKLSAPLERFKITSGCGVRKDPMGGAEEGFHKGIDIVGPIGGFILAAADGVVVDCWPPPGRYYKGHPVFGGMIILAHGGGIFTLYGHMRAILIRQGDRVHRGQRIGRQGNTGISTGEHLHFEVIVDPEVVLNGIIPRSVVEW